MQVLIETVRVEGEPSDGSGGEGFSRATMFTPTKGTIVNVFPGDGGGGERHPAFIDENTGQWGAHVTTDNNLPAGDRAFFNYHLVCIWGGGDPPAGMPSTAPILGQPKPGEQLRTWAESRGANMSGFSPDSPDQT